MSPTLTTFIDEKSPSSSSIFVSTPNSSRPASFISSFSSSYSPSELNYCGEFFSMSGFTSTVVASGSNDLILIKKVRNLDPSPKYTSSVGPKEKFLDGTSIIIDSTDSSFFRSTTHRSTVSDLFNAMNLTFVPSVSPPLPYVIQSPSPSSSSAISSSSSSPASQPETSFEILRNLQYIRNYRDALYFSLEDELNEDDEDNLEIDSSIPSTGNTSARIFTLPRYTRVDTVEGRRLCKTTGKKSKNTSTAERSGEWVEDKLVGVWNFLKQPSRV